MDEVTNIQEAAAPSPGAAESELPYHAELSWDPQTGGLADPDQGPLGLEGDLEDQIVAYARLAFGPPCPIELRLRQIDARGARTYTANGRGEITITVTGVDEF